MTDVSTPDPVDPSPLGATQDLGDQINAAVNAAIQSMQVPLIMWGVVNSIQNGPPPTLTVTLQGDSASVAGVAFASNYAPSVSDTVMCMSVNNNMFVVMSPADKLSGINGFQPGDRIETHRAETARPGWLPEDGTGYSTLTYPDLFAEIGYRYGGSGTTFNVPNSVAKFSYGAGTGVALGSTGGTTTIAATMLPVSPPWAATQAAHNHTLSPAGTIYVAHTNASVTLSGGPSPFDNATLASATPVITMGNNAGGGATFLPPYLAMNRWIKT